MRFTSQPGGQGSKCKTSHGEEIPGSQAKRVAGLSGLLFPEDDDPTQETQDRGQPETDEITRRVQVFCGFLLEQIRLAPAGDAGCRSHQEEQGTKDDFILVVWRASRIIGDVVVHAGDGCHHRADRRQGNVCKRSLFQDFEALPQQGQEDKEKRCAGESDRKMHDHGVYRVVK